MAGEYLKLVRIIAGDSLRLADLVQPADAAEVVIVRGARHRAERILAGFGNDESGSLTWKGAAARLQ
jgi:hypothetical protein